MIRDVQTVSTAHHAVDAPRFRADLLAWGDLHFRSFPWRTTNDPYRVLMAEVMLHRTQASQVAPVYARFVAQYPDLVAAAQANTADLHNSLYALGLRWRIELIRSMIEELLRRFDGQVPQQKDDLLSLPGVSDYIASAVRCFAWHLPDAIVDTNTVRIVGRVFELEVKDSSRRNRQFRELLDALVDVRQPERYNYALLDLGALICTKKVPHCERCPVAAHCKYGQTTLAATVSQHILHNEDVQRHD